MAAAPSPARIRRDIPPPLELECLKALWVLGEGNVRAVREVLKPSKALAYTTIMTILDRLVKRGGVTRRKVGRSFLYAPAVEREVLRQFAVRELVDCFFDGSEKELLSYLEPGGQPAYRKRRFESKRAWTPLCCRSPRVQASKPRPRN